MLIEEIAEYQDKATILRQINSNKARRYLRINNVHSAITVVVSGFITFVGFTGLDRLAPIIGVRQEAHAAYLVFLFNLSVFMLFVLVILHLVFGFHRKQLAANAAVVSLSAYINEVDDLVAKVRIGAAEGSPGELDTVRQKYNSVTSSLPSHTDEEWRRAIHDYQEKKRRKPEPQPRVQELFDPSAQRRVVEQLVMRNRDITKILKTIKAVNSDFFLGGGLVRNIVWDYLHGYDIAKPIDDVDIVYFSRLSSSREQDRQYEADLGERLRTLRWSVKNQARMHEPNLDPEYESLEDAISKWPEICTAFGIRLASPGHIEIVAPYGLSDLFRLLVRPTPPFQVNAFKIRRYRERIAAKSWQETWPRLIVIDAKDV